MDDLRRKFDAEREHEMEAARQRAKKLIADVQAQSDGLLREVDALLAQKEGRTSPSWPSRPSSR